MLIRNARVWPSGACLAGEEEALAEIPRTDVRMAAGVIAECGPDLRPESGEEVIDAAGGTLLPGLHDHHVHLRALAAAAGSVAVGPPQARTPADLAARLSAADAGLPPGAWLRAVGYHESVAGALDRRVLDGLVPHRPVRVQHRTGALWMVNSLAVAQLGLDGCDLGGVERDDGGRPTGRLWRMDRWLTGRVPSAAADLGAVSRRAGSFGVTGFTDATPGATDDDLSSLAEAPVAQRLHCMVPPGVCPPSGRITAGPVKILLDDAALPSLDEFADRIRGAHAENRPAAVHCVTRVQLVLTVAALDLAGRLPGDRIEHGAVIGSESLPALRGLTVVTQPHFVVERGEQYAADVSPGDLPDLWRLRSLIVAGVNVAAGSDAPFGDADPWRVMRAAVRRPQAFRAAEAVSPAQALALFLGQPGAPASPRLVGRGHPADLMLLRAGPLEALRSLSSDLVAATFVGGEVVYVRRLARLLACGMLSRVELDDDVVSRALMAEEGATMTSAASLAAELELSLSATGTPANPLVTIRLDRWRDAPTPEIAAAARLVAEALPVTAAILEGPPDPALAPLIEAATLTLAPASSQRSVDVSSAGTEGGHARWPLERAVVWVGDVGLGIEEAVAGLRDAVAHSPRAAVACGQLVRQTAAIAPEPRVGTTAALAAEAAAYSLLLGGPEFARWLRERGAPRRRKPPAEPVRVVREDDRLVITLDDPERRNAFSARLREALLDALAVAEADDAVASVELRGSGPAFCAGGDLDEFGSADDLVAAYLVRLARAPWRAIDRIAPKVTVYAHGACVGAGTEITAYAGRVIAAPDAYFTLPEVRMGLVPGAGGSVSVPRRIGRWRAAWLMLTGTRLPATVALRWGLADSISGP